MIRPPKRSRVLTFVVAFRGTVLNSNYRMYLSSSTLCCILTSPRCLAHVVNLGTVDVMKNITKIAAVENATAIWEYDPTLPGNHVLGGSLDVILAIRTLAIKIQAPGQRIEYFLSTQIRCGLHEGLKIPLHSNIRWGSAFKMLDQANKLRQVRQHLR